MKRMPFWILLFLSVHSFGQLIPHDGFPDSLANAAGAWARSGQPDDPVLVVTNATVWMRVGTKWRPSFDGSPREGGISFSMNGLEGGFVFSKPEPWEIRDLAQQGVSVTEHDMVFAKNKRENNRYVLSEGSRMVPCNPPDWNNVLDVSSYVGTWESVASKSRGRDPLLLKIRPDFRAVFCSTRNGVPRPDDTIILPLVPTEGWLRVDFRKWNRTNDFNDRLSGLWINAEGHLLEIHSFEVIEYVRAANEMTDPFDERTAMMKEKRFHGNWGGGEGFGKCCFSFDKSGKGLYTCVLGRIPFEWTADDSGFLQCRFDAEWVEVFGGGDDFEKEFSVRFDPEGNQMELLSVGKGLVDAKTLKFVPGEVRVLAVFEQIEAYKRSPEYEAMKARKAKPKGN